MKLLMASTFVCLGFNLAILGCSKAKDQPGTSGTPGAVETFPITTAPLKNCQFQQPSVTYTFETKIEPNGIRCEEGVPRKIEVLSPSNLPLGLRVEPSQLALIGTPRERVTGAQYVVYLENEAGYVRIPLSITVK